MGVHRRRLLHVCPTALGPDAIFRYIRAIMAWKYRLATLGCKVNQYESQQIRDVLASFAFRPARHGERADIAVVNTCAVTASASRKSRQAIRRVGDAGRTPVVVVGCGASADAERLRAIDGVEAVIGHDTDIPLALATILADRFARQQTDSLPDGSHVRNHEAERPDAVQEKVWMNPVEPRQRRRESPSRIADNPASAPIIPPVLPVVKTPDTLATHIHAFDGHQRAFLKVQDGCDAYCTYCIIPRLRANLRSKPVEVAVHEAIELVRHGHKEIIVTGIFLGAYGRDTAIRKRFGQGGSPLATLVSGLAGVPGLERLRLSSLEPGDVTEELLEVLASRSNCVPHLHLPLQSGSEAILRRMNRQYSREDFVDMLERVSRSLDRPAISTDIIVGFPGETEADFEASLEIARQAEFCKIHAFPFSPREQTAAARWQADFVPTALTRARLKQLAKLETEMSLQFRRRFVGLTERVLVETSHPGDKDPFRALHSGRSDRYFRIHFEDDPDDALGTKEGDIVTVRIDRVTPGRTVGTLLRPESRDYPLPILEWPSDDDAA